MRYNSSGVGRVVSDRQGNSFELKPVACPICDTRDIKALGMRGGSHHRYGLGVATEVVRCRSCGLLFPDPFPYPTDPQRLYGDPESYFARKDPAVHLSGAVQVVREAVRRGGTEPLLDVGSGSGDILCAARDEEIDAVGLDLSEAMVAHARERHGVNVERATLEAYAQATERRFGTVILSAILEHVHDPDSFLAAASSLARRGAVLYVDTPRDPNLLTWIANAYERLRGTGTVLNLSPTFAPYHVYGFSPKSLEALLTKHGFAIEELHIHANPTIPSRSGSDRVKAFVATQVGRVANLTRSASNMTVWARRR